MGGRVSTAHFFGIACVRCVISVAVCHCLEQAVLDVSWPDGTACSKQWHTVVRNAG